jgi:CubicO group peptidase (beta-lactamase class C family)
VKSPPISSTAPSANLCDVILKCIVLLSTALATAPGTRVPAIPSAKLATVRTRLNALANKGFSGVTLIQRNNETVFDESFGSVNARRVEKSDLFWIASISKSFTAAAVMKCREKGLIKLDDPITRFWPDAPADKQSITIAELLGHTSGLPQSYVSETIEDRESAAKALLKEKLVSAPGMKFGYSNSNYELLAAAIEIVTHRRFEEFIRAELLRPLQLGNTGFWFDEQAKHVSATHEPLPARLKRRGWELGAGGMYSRADDLVHWSNALLAGKVLSHESTKLIFTDHIQIAEGKAGFGWFHGKSTKGTDFWFTRGNDSFGPNALIYSFPTLHTTVVITSHGGDDESSDTGWSRIALREVMDALEF